MLGQVSKALTALVAAGYGLYVIATKPDSPAGGGITRDEWIGILATAFAAAAAVWLVPNTSKPAAPVEDGTAGGSAEE